MENLPYISATSGVGFHQSAVFSGGLVITVGSFTPSSVPMLLLTLMKTFALVAISLFGNWELLAGIELILDNLLPPGCCLRLGNPSSILLHFSA